MKAQLIESNNNHLGLRGHEGKVHKSKHKEEENEEIKAYLTKLQELVPFMPKNRKLSKLEVITYVIDYIRDLRQTLGLPPNSSLPLDFDSFTGPPHSTSVLNTPEASPVQVMSTATTTTSTSESPQVTAVPSASIGSRQPLGVSLLNTLNGSCASQEIPNLMDKSPDVDTRLSC